jgi:tRNA threonylcarbamoyladenosine biosynthesis protein TsaB
MKLTVHIDTSQKDATRVSLRENSRTLRECEATRGKAQAVLPLIEKVLGDTGKTFEDIGEITAAIGPGSYTGLRVGLAVAITLSSLLGIPINGLPPGSHIPPLYDTDDKFAMMDE